MTRTLKLVSPVNGEVFAERPVASHAQVEAALAAARKAQAAWAARPVAERADAVREAVARLRAMNDEAVPELAWMMGRPVRYGGEIGGVEERAHHMAEIADDALAPLVIEDSARFRRVIRREPLGVVMVIAPWNYPYLTAINAIAPGLIAGNAVVLKHATQTLLAGERLARAFDEAGLPEGLFANLVLDHATTEAMIGGRMVDFVNFTGSVRGGHEIERAAAGTFIGVGLELGGKDPGYVRADADPAAAAEQLMDGALFNSGQCCCGIERIYVAAPLFDAFVEKAVEIASGHVLGNPLEPETTLGPMAQPRFAKLVREQVAEAFAAGARALVDPARFSADDGAGAYLTPQVLVGVDHSMRLMREENFGPVVGIMAVQGDDEAVALLNDSEYGLTAAICTDDAAAAEAIGARLETGTVFMNRCDYLDPALCWTGCKNTGRGAALSVLGYHSLTRPKSYHLRKA
ncbi:MAG TPA: aldehyde dehydrogenase family protein [Thermohalobaculum sp.]|nr:aldehyde dehydrogenase family protein [Thermohalobaculum sp.]